MSTVDISDISFDPSITFSSGQTFRWKQISENGGMAWQGVIHGVAVRISRDSVTCLGASLGSRKLVSSAEFSFLIRDYLSSQDDLNLIRSSLPKELFLQSAMAQFRGLRILTQEPWECLVSFLCSINKNIPSIVSEIELLSRKFGKRIENISGPEFSFPSATDLANASKSDLLACKVGFRWKYIKHIARQVSSGNLDLDSLSRKSYDECRNELIADLSGRTFGVGPKVADCFLLFSLHNLEAFPLDVWMLRCMREKYSNLLCLTKFLEKDSSLTRRKYELLHQAARSYFGPFCGYAQQYLYMKMRLEYYSKYKAGL